MSIKQFRLSAQARNQLIRLKTRTGITQWNILCRWAFCLSLRQPTPPTPIEIPQRQQRRIDVAGFWGRGSRAVLDAAQGRCEHEGLGTSDDVLLRQFRLHLHRGINHLATPQAIRSIEDLVRLALEDGQHPLNDGLRVRYFAICW